MPTVRMPDGALVAFPDDMPADQIRGLIQQKFPDAAQQAAAPAVPPVADVPLPKPAPEAKTVSSYPLQPEVQGAGRGLVSLVSGLDALTPTGAARNTAALISSILGGPKIPTMQGAMIDAGSKVAEKIGIPVADYSNAPIGEQLRTNAADLGVQAAAGSAGLLNAARIRAAEVAGGSLPRAFDSFLRPYTSGKVAPTLVGDAAATAGGAAGKTAVDQTSYKGNPLTEAGGILFGGLGGITALNSLAGVSRGLASGIRRQFGGDLAPVNIDAATGLPVSTRAFDAAAGKVRASASYPDEAAARMQANAAELRGLDPQAPMPSPAALAEDPGLASLEGMVNRMDPGAAMARQREFATGVRDTIDRTAPQGADPGALVNAARREADFRTAGANAAEDNVRFDAATAQRAAEAEIARLENRVAQLEGRGNRVQDIRVQQGEQLRSAGGRGIEASQNLDRNIVDQGYVPARTEKNRLYNEGVPPDTPVDLTGVRAAAGDVQGRVAQLPPSMREAAANPALLDDMAQMERGTYDQARQTRMALSDEATKARASGDFGRADNIDTLRRPLNEAIDTANPAAEANYRENFAPTYRPGPGDEAAKFTRALDRDPTRSSTPPSQTAGRFLQPGQTEKHAALARMIQASETPLAGQAAAREYLLADMVEKGVVDARTGLINNNRLRQWQERWGDLSNVVPGFQDALNTLRQDVARGEGLSQRVATAGEQTGQRLTEAQQRARTTAQQFESDLRNAQKNSKLTQDQIDKGALGAVLNADTDKTVASIMSRPNESGRLLDELIQTIGNDQQAKDGLKAAVRDFLIDKATTGAAEKLKPGDRRGPVSQAKLSAIFKEHETELAKVFSPEEMNTLRAGHRALELANVERLRTGSGSDTAEKTALIFDQLLNSPVGKGVEAAMRIKYGLLKAGGLVSTGRRMFSGATGGPDPAEVSRLLERAAVDPELMGLLLGRKVPVASPSWNAKMQQLLAVKEATDAD